MKKGILFDLDGTLWDSAEGVALSWNRALEKLGRPERMTTEKIHSLMGKVTDEIAAELFPQTEKEESLRILKRCMEEENAYLAEHGGILYRGLEDTLRELKTRGYFLGVVSNCQAGYIEAFLTAHRLEACFDDTESHGRTGMSKAGNIRLVAERNGLERVWYVGDTMGDYEAAAGAGVSFLHAAYGFGSVPEGTPRIREIRELPRLMAQSGI